MMSSEQLKQYHDKLKTHEPNKKFYDLNNFPPQERAKIELLRDLGPYMQRFEEYRADAVTKGLPTTSTAHPDRISDAARQIFEARETAGIERDALAEKLEVDRIFYEAFEAGLIPPHLVADEFLQKLSDVLTAELDKKLEDHQENESMIPNLSEDHRLRMLELIEKDKESDTQHK